MELSVIFDREHRLYKFGEVISGKVVLKPESDRTYSDIWITYFWQTHGRGSKDRGLEEKLILSREKLFLCAGACMEFPFHFEAPNGPVTYHGHLLNVDWYLIAYAQIDLLGHPINGRKEFLLQAGEPTCAVVLGDKEILFENLPYCSSETQTSTEDALITRKAGSARPVHVNSENVKLRGWILSSILTFMYLVTYGDLSYIFYIISFYVIGFVLIVIWRKTHRRNPRVVLGRNEIPLENLRSLGKAWVSPSTLHGDSKVFCHVDFMVKIGFHLRSITATIYAQERVISMSATGTVTDFHLIEEKSHTKSFNEDLEAGRLITFDCTLPVHPDAPATFSSTNNNLEWTVMLKVNIKGWPDWEKTLPITMLPGVSRDEQELSVMLDGIRPSKRS